MTQASKYVRTTDFSDEELANTGGRSTVRTAAVDAELDAVGVSLNRTIVNQILNQRDDGEIRDGRVKVFTLASDVLALLTAYGAIPRGAWLTTTAYAFKDLVAQGGNTYIAVTPHTSGVFATDLAAGKWLLFSLSATPSASAVTFTPTANLSSTNAQAAIEETDTENRALSSTAQAAAVAAQAAAAGAVTTASSALTAALTSFADTASVGNGDALVGFKRTVTGAIASTLHLYHEAQLYNVASDFGADVTGVASSDTAFQACADAIAASQNPQVAPQKITKAVMYIPDGNFRKNVATKLRGFFSVLGAGVGYAGGSTIRQYTAATNIFELYGSTADNASLGVCIQGINFEFDAAIPNGTATGFAILCPRVNDIGGSFLSSNSIYVRDCRFGGWSRQGNFIKINHGDDIEISRCVIDVDSATSANNTIVLGDAADSTAKVTNLRIHGNNFFFCYKAIALRNVDGFTITGNNFDVQFANDWTAIDMTAGGATIVQGRIKNGVIEGNNFWQCYVPFRVDGSMIDVTIGHNEYGHLLDYLLVTTGSTDIERLQILGGGVQLATTGQSDPASFARATLMQSTSCLIKNSTIADLQVDCSGLTSLMGLGAEQSGPASMFGVGMTLRNFSILNNPNVPLPGSCAALMPCSARELTLEDQQTFTTYPTTAPIFNLNTINVADSVTFDLDYEVVVSKTGSNVGVRTGRVRVSITRYATAGTLKSDVTSIASIGDDFNGAGGTQIPTVTFSVATTGPAYVGVTITCAIATGSPFLITTKCKALNFRASGTPQIKSA